jgi:hypothetical protein
VARAEELSANEINVLQPFDLWRLDLQTDMACTFEASSVGKLLNITPL